MKLVIKEVSIILLFLLNALHAGAQQYNWDYYGYKGQVKLVHQKEYYTDKKKAGKISDWSFTSFHENGSIRCDSGMSYVMGHVYKYTYSQDTNNRVIEEKVSYKPSGWVFQYDSFYYDTKGNRTGKIQFNHRGRITEIYVYSYDEKGNMTEYSTHDSDGNMQWKYTFKYDSLGNQTEDCQLTPSGSLYFFLKFKYDHKRNLIDRTAYNPDSSMVYKFSYTYDKYNNEIESCGYKTLDKIAGCGKTIYEYDNVGNWTKESRYINGVLTKIRDRKIYYY